MPSYNHCVIVGNLTADPEMRYTAKGAAICGFTLAVNRNWTSESGEKKEECSFIPCTAFGKQGETIAQYMKKGRPLLVSGRLRQENWEDKNTHEKRSKLGVVLESFTFIDSAKPKSESAEKPAAKQTELPADDDPPVPF